MRKWTKSACVVVAWGIGFLVAVVGFSAAAGYRRFRSFRPGEDQHRE